MTPPPTRLLLAVSTSRYSRHLVESAVEEARQLQQEGPVSIALLVVREDEELERAGQRVGDVGLLGLSAQSDVLDALGKEHDRQARRMAEKVHAAALAHGIPVHQREVAGRFADCVLAEAERTEAAVILITRADRPFISRILFGSVADRVARIARRDGLGRVIIDE